MKRTLFNIDALVELICGLVFLFNPLLGPALPVSSGIVSALGVVLLVACILLGRAGMGRGPLFPHMRLIATVNMLSGVGVVGWSAIDDSFTSTGRIFVWVIAAVVVALGVAELLLGERPPPMKPRRSTQSQRLEAIGRGKPRR